MSDGPFKRPLTKRCWQPVADRAANENFSIAQVRETIPAALGDEFRTLPERFKRGLKRVFMHDRSNSLLDPRETGEIENLRAEGAGHSLAMLTLDCIEDSLGQGMKGVDALIDSTAAVLEQCYGENARSIDEHAQCDRLDDAVTQSIRRRLEAASPSPTELDDLAHSLWRLQEERVPRTAPKHRDLDEGDAVMGLGAHRRRFGFNRFGDSGVVALARASVFTGSCRQARPRFIQ